MDIKPKLSAHNQRMEWVLDACLRLMRPIVRLAIVYGVKHPQLAGLLRRLMIEESIGLWKNNGVLHPNVSQLSITSGLNRKLVTTQVRGKAESLSVTETSLASRVFTHWMHLAHSQPQYKSLPVIASADVLSFEAMVKKLISNEVHHKTIAVELLRLGLVEQDEETIRLLKDAFVPSEDERIMLAFAADNGTDHLLAAMSNIAGKADPLLERAVFADGLSEAGAIRVEQYMREQWAVLHNQLVSKMQQEIDIAQGQAPHPASHRIRVGVYVYHEPVKADSKEQPNV